ncbi:MAG: tetratricopeptide repeat protein [Planctomycetes bacterium]|nr:tetratricopeptide repeat protein [Planctomycetota bacterium]
MAQQPQPEQQVTVAELRSQLTDRWQIPLLLLSMVVFVGSALLLVVQLGKEKVDPGMLLQRARDAYEVGSFAASDSLCEDFLKQFSDHPSTDHSTISEVHELRGDANYALARLDVAREMDLLKKAQICYRDAMEHRPAGSPSPRLQLKLGRTAAEMGDYEAAVGHYDRALESEIENRLEIHRAKIQALRSMEPEPQIDEALAEVAVIHKELGDHATEEQRREVALIEADLLNAKGRYAEAEAILRKVAGQDMSKVFLLALADTQRLAGRYTDAIDTLFELLDRKSTDEAQRQAEEDLDVQAFQMQGRVSYDMKNYERALHWFHRTVDEYPGTDMALVAKLGIAQTYLVLDESDLASEVYTEIAPQLRRLRPGQNRWIDLEASRAALCVQSENARKTGNIDDALKFVMLEESILRDPDVDVWQRKAGILAQIADRDAAEAASGEAMAESARQSLRLKAERAWNEAGDLYLRIAEEFHGQTQKEYPNDLWAASRCFMLAGSHERAIKVLDRFIREQPGDTRGPQARLEMARQYEVLGRLDETIRVLQELRIESGDSLAGFEGLYRLGNAYVQMGPDFYDQAEEAYRKLVEDSTTKVEPESLWYRNSLLQLARLLHRRGDYDRAIISLNEFLQRYPTDPDSKSASYLIASSVRRQGLKALEKSEKAVRKTDKDAFMEIYRQKTQSAIEQYRQRVRDYEALPRQDLTLLREQEYRAILFEQAECLLELGRLDEATTIYNTIVYRFQMDPCVMAAYVKLATAYETSGHKDKAQAVYERAQWTLEKIPEEAFAMRIGEPSKQYWANWIQTMRQN